MMKIVREHQYRIIIRGLQYILFTIISLVLFYTISNNRSAFFTNIAIKNSLFLNRDPNYVPEIKKKNGIYEPEQTEYKLFSDDIFYGIETYNDVLNFCDTNIFSVVKLLSNPKNKNRFLFSLPSTDTIRISIRLRPQYPNVYKPTKAVFPYKSPD